jgi:hypothetical protein
MSKQQRNQWHEWPDDARMERFLEYLQQSEPEESWPCASMSEIVLSILANARWHYLSDIKHGYGTDFARGAYSTAWRVAYNLHCLRNETLKEMFPADPGDLSEVHA